MFVEKATLAIGIDFMDRFETMNVRIFPIRIKPKKSRLVPFEMHNPVWHQKLWAESLPRRSLQFISSNMNKENEKL